MNRWILRGLATAGCAAGGWLLTAAPAFADAPTTTTAQHAESGTLLGIRLDRNADDRPLLRLSTGVKARATTRDSTATTRVRVTVIGDRTPATAKRSTRSVATARVRANVSGGAGAARPSSDRHDRPARPAAKVTACLSVLALDDCGTSTAPAATTRRPVADARTAIALDRGGLDVCLNAAVLGKAAPCRTAPTAVVGRPGIDDANAVDAAVTVNDGLHVCLNAALLGGTAGCGSEPANRPVLNVVVAALDPATLNACLAIGVLGEPASCSPGATPPGEYIAGAEACVAIGSTGCDSPAGTDGMGPGTNPGTGPGPDPGTGPGTDPGSGPGTDPGTGPDTSPDAGSGNGTGTETGTGTGTGEGFGVSPAGHDDRTDHNGRNAPAMFGDAFTAGTTGLPRTAELALTGSALAGTALALILAGFLLIVGTRRRTT
jgi:hypothetical protein